MLQLDQLILELATLIVKYHDSQKSNNSSLQVCVPETSDAIKKRRNHAKMILQQNNWESNLLELVEKCTTKYNERKEFLLYILNQIGILKRFSKNLDTDITEIHVESSTAIIKQFLSDLLKLIKTTKADEYIVTIHHLGHKPYTTKSLHGLAYGSYITHSLCASGEFLNELFQFFHLNYTKLDVTSEEVNEFCNHIADDIKTIYKTNNNICQNHEMQKKPQETELTQTTKSQDDHDQTTHTVNQLNYELGESKKKIEILEQQLILLKHSESQLRSENEQFHLNLGELAGSVSKLTNQLNEQKQQCQQDEEELKSLRAENNSLKKFKTGLHSQLPTKSVFAAPFGIFGHNISVDKSFSRIISPSKQESPSLNKID